jgi:hypothetical protein
MDRREVSPCRPVGGWTAAGDGKALSSQVRVHAAKRRRAPTTPATLFRVESIGIS